VDHPAGRLDPDGGAGSGAVLGVFGSGPLSSAEVTSPDGTLRVEYERFVRREVEHELSVTVTVEDRASGEVEVWLDVASLDTMVVDTISPEPTEERIEGERQVFVFAVGDAEHLLVRFDVAREDMGRNRVSLGIVGGSETSFSQVSYP
jgi:hypothetical protein